MTPTLQDLQDAEQAEAFHADQLAFEQSVRDALRAARTRPLTEEEIGDLCFLAGIRERDVR